MTKKSYRITTWDEYCELSAEEQRHVSVVSFTGLTELTAHGTLGVEQSAGGSSAPVSDDETP